VPDVLAGRALDGDDAIGAKVVAWTAADRTPGSRLSRTHIDEIFIGIIGHAAPDRAAAARNPPLLGGIPGLGPLRVDGLFEWFGRVAGNRIKLPQFFSGGCVKRREKTADGIFAAAGADNDTATLDYTGGHRDRIGQVGWGDPGFPEKFAVSYVESPKASVEYRRDHLTFIQRQTTVDDTAASRSAAIRFRIRLPKLFAGARVHRIHKAVWCDAVKNAVGNQIRGFLSGPSSDVGNVQRPCQTQLFYIVCIDLIHRTIPRLRPIPIVGNPFFLVLRGILQSIVVDFLAALLRQDCDREGEYHESRE